MRILRSHGDSRFSLIVIGMQLFVKKPGHFTFWISRFMVSPKR